LKTLYFHQNFELSYGLLGPSGCGKTTLLRCIVGRLKPISGYIKVFGSIPGTKNACIPGPGVGFMPQVLQNTKLNFKTAVK
jgi:ABC-type multidrug transport system ATPase subunit